jgi:D-arabinan endo alpha-(1,5)-arabinofuranosidase
VTERLATKVADLTGPGITDRFGIGGTDLGTTATAPQGHLV